MFIQSRSAEKHLGIFQYRIFNIEEIAAVKGQLII